MSDIQLYNDDCFNIFPQIADKSVDMICCDLPYGTTACKWDSILPFDKLWEQYKRIIKDNGAIVLFGSEPFASIMRCSNLKMYRYDWIWKKNAGSNFGSCKYQPMKEHESISIFSKNTCVYYPIMQERAESGKDRVKTPIKYNTSTECYSKSLHNQLEVKQSELRVPSSVQFFNRERGFHPTQKPVALLEYLVKTYTLEGETILDNCMGSGTCGVACKNLNRNFIGIEKEKEYFDIAEKRINEARIEPTLFGEIE